MPSRAALSAWPPTAGPAPWSRRKAGRISSRVILLGWRRSPSFTLGRKRQVRNRHALEPRLRPVLHCFHPVGFEGGLDVAGHEQRRRLEAAKCGVQMSQRKTSYEKMGLLAGAELVNRPHRPGDPGRLIWIRNGPGRLVLALDVIDEMLVVGSLQDEEPLRWRSSVKQLVNRFQRYRHIQLRRQVERRHSMAPCEGQT